MVRFLGNGRYVLGEELGVGGMGVVYAAADLARTERVAIKVAHTDRDTADIIAEHMARELRIGLATAHPNVVRVFDGGHEEMRPFIVMELAAGQTLGLLATAERLSIRRVADIVDQILAGLAAIHRAGFIHGDVKSDNVLVTSDDVVKIIDLGLACEQTSTEHARSGVRMISGTPHYLAPEVALGGPKTVASELYAVGALLYELLTGTPPFAGEIDEVLRSQIEDEVIPPSLRMPELKLSLALERVVLRALHKDPRERYADAPELRAALRAAIQDSRDLLLGGGFSTTGPTLPELRPLPRPARGTSAPTGDPHVLVEAALDATRSFLVDRRLSAARAEVEAALHLVEHDPAGERVAWRLLLVLAAICDAQHDPHRARRVARLALESAARAGSDLGRRRAKALIERFAGRPAPQARA